MSCKQFISIFPSLKFNFAGRRGTTNNFRANPISMSRYFETRSLSRQKGDKRKVTSLAGVPHSRILMEGKI